MNYGDAAGTALDFLKKVGGAAASVALEQIEVSSPSELKGAKLTRGFQVIKAGDKYKIIIDKRAAIPGVPASWLGVELPDTGKEFTVPLGPISVKYTPAPSNMKLYILAAGILVAAIVAVKKFS